MLAEDVIVMFVFWEFTTILSYLLIGFTRADAKARFSALQALIVTTAGGLALLVGLIGLSVATGSTHFTDIVAAAPELSGSALVSTSLVLVLAGAVSKSALVPLHFWLPGAMAAPTPVSAYLHAAAMVKAGVYLVARLAPGYAGETALEKREASTTSRVRWKSSSVSPGKPTMMSVVIAASGIRSRTRSRMPRNFLLR